MNGLWIILAAAILLMTSGLPARFGARQSNAAQRLACALMILGSLTGWCGLATVLFSAEPCSLSIPWHLPWGRFSVGLDALSSVFLVPVFTIPALGSVYGLRYWKQTEHPENGRGLSLFYGLMTGSMVLVVIARDWIVLLVFWEIMAISAYFLTALEHEKPEHRQASWIYLVAMHIGAICLIALIALIRQLTGSFAFAQPDAKLLTSGIAATLFVLAILSFGFKAETLPLIWLPNAHANTPSHVAATMSGVLLKMGIYGLLRFLTLLPATELWNGGVLLGIGAATGILGIAFAIGQSDINRLLAYSSIENIGIIIMGIGLALLGRVLHRTDLVLLGLGGSLLHVWNHSLFKPLLFLNAGAVIHATHTRDMNRLGGLAKKMPQTAGLFLLGSAAICCLPPLNGFTGKWLIYMGLFRTLNRADGAACPAAGTGAVALALIGALALACFVKIYSTVFLGQPRNSVPSAPQDPHPLMCYPMFLLAAGCVVLGVLPQTGLPLIRQAAAQWLDPSMQESPLTGALAPVQWISGAAFILIIVSGIAMAVILKKIQRQPSDAIGTWICGYARPVPRAQYTATSFGEMLVNRFSWALQPRTQQPVIDSMFPRKTRFSTLVQDTVLDRIVLPLFRFAGHQMMKLRLIQQGRTNIYLLYVLIIMLFLLCWDSLGIGR